MELSKLIRQAGIIGCGGAGFPTHIKYEGSQIDTILINGVECEPLLQTDRFLMRTYGRELLEASEMLLQETKARECVIVLKASYKREVAALESAIAACGSPVRLHLLDSFFPAGDEQAIVYEVTGKVVPPAGIPLMAGCVVNNVATLYGIYEAMKGRAFTHKYLTITGEVNSPAVARVPVGLPVSQCLALAGGVRTEDYMVVDGGPMMGRVMTREEADTTCVTKTMSGLLVLPRTNPVVQRSQTSVKHMKNRAAAACIRCSLCTQMCPRALLGHPLQPHRIMQKWSLAREESVIFDDVDIRAAALCCSCGICEIYACPMGLQPRAVNAYIKKELAGRGIRYEAKEWARKALPERSFRKAPTARVAARAGILEYEKVQVSECLREPEKNMCKMVCMNLRQGIGAASEPLIESGEWVEAGQLIADCPPGKMGSALHASISGIASIGESCFSIEARERPGAGKWG